jgi:hypothetical protein
MQKKHFRHLKVVRIVLLLQRKREINNNVLNVIQRLAGATEESALIIVEDKAKVLEMESLLKKYGKNS